MPENQSGTEKLPPISITTLRKRADFLALRRAKSASVPAFLMACRQNPKAGDDARIGLTVTKKLGNAVTRNRIRRRLRAVVREVFPDYGRAGTDYVLIARRAAESRNYQAILDDMKRALLSLHGNPK